MSINTQILKHRYVSVRARTHTQIYIYIYTHTPAHIHTYHESRPLFTNLFLNGIELAPP